jgi:glutathione peroxidase
MPHISELSLTRLDQTPLLFSELDNKVVLIVNVASKCGLTPQYEGLVKLYEQYRDQGLVVLGVPCNQFGGQEPGDAEAIENFCTSNYGVSFPILEKQDVNGPNRSQLYTYLVDSDMGGGEDIQWNFAKFLLDREGDVLARYLPTMQPDDVAFLATIKAELISPR